MPDNRLAQMTEAEFWSQVGDQESMVVEFKQQLPRPSRLQEPLVAFANSRGGTVIVGVSDRRPRQVVGVGAPDHERRRTEHLAGDAVAGRRGPARTARTRGGPGRC